MTAPIVSQADLERVHRNLRITTPIEQMSPLLLATLTIVARNWKKPQRQPVIDFKRRAAGDID